MTREQLRQMITETARQYGISPSYMLAKASFESTMNASAKNPRSSARGLYQQLNANWRKYGRGGDRNDPIASTDAAARFTLDNQKAFQRAFGRAPNDRELYLMHQQGPSGAIKLLRNPDAPATSVVGKKAVILNGGNTRMSAGQFASKIQSQFGNRLAKFEGRGTGSKSSRMELSETPTLKDFDTRALSYSQEPSMRASSVEEQVMHMLNEDGRLPVHKASMMPPIRGKGGKMTENPVGAGSKSPNKVKQIEQHEGGGVPAEYFDKTPVTHQKPGNLALSPSRRVQEGFEDAGAARPKSSRGETEAGMRAGAPLTVGVGGAAAAQMPMDPNAEAGGEGADEYGGMPNHWFVDMIQKYINGGNQAQQEAAAQPKSVQTETVAPQEGGSSTQDQILHQVIQSAGPAVGEAMQNPQTADAANHVLHHVVSNVARQDAERAAGVQQQAFGPTPNQQMVGNMGMQGPHIDPSSSSYSQMQDMAVMQDNAQFGGLLDFFMGQ